MSSSDEEEAVTVKPLTRPLLAQKTKIASKVFGLKLSTVISSTPGNKQAISSVGSPVFTPVGNGQSNRIDSSLEDSSEDRDNLKQPDFDMSANLFPSSESIELDIDTEVVPLPSQACVQKEDDKIASTDSKLPTKVVATSDEQHTKSSCSPPKVTKGIDKLERLKMRAHKTQRIASGTENRQRRSTMRDYAFK